MGQFGFFDTNNRLEALLAKGDPLEAIDALVPWESFRETIEACNVARGTAQRAFAELQERGFIECVTQGAFSRKAPHASEWRLTFNTCDVTGELPSKKFMSWGREKQNAVSKYPVAVSNQSHRAA